MSVIESMKKKLSEQAKDKPHVLAFRSTESTRRELKEIAKILNASQNWIITTLIHEAYRDLKAKGRG